LKASENKVKKSSVIQHLRREFSRGKMDDSLRRCESGIESERLNWLSRVRGGTRGLENAHGIEERTSHERGGYERGAGDKRSRAGGTSKQTSLGELPYKITWGGAVTTSKKVLRTDESNTTPSKPDSDTIKNKGKRLSGEVGEQETNVAI